MSGPLKRPDDSLKLRDVARETAMRYESSRFMFDLRDAKITGSVLDTHDAGRAGGDPDFAGHHWRAALIYSGNMGDHRFLETVARNAGADLRAFEDYDEGFAWLIQDS